LPPRRALRRGAGRAGRGRALLEHRTAKLPAGSNNPASRQTCPGRFSRRQCEDGRRVAASQPGSARTVASHDAIFDLGHGVGSFRYLTALGWFWRPSEASMTPGWKVRVRGPRHGGTVRAENHVHGSDQKSCSPSRPAVMITDQVPAVRLPLDHTCDLMAAAIPPRGRMEDRGDPDPAPPARRTAILSEGLPDRHGSRPPRGPSPDPGAALGNPPHAKQVMPATPPGAGAIPGRGQVHRAAGLLYFAAVPGP
jgi:hypothetical protein